jgi:hypothetical protein
MARIIVHAGMGKAGSTSIQAWLAAHSAALHSTGTTPVVATVDGHDRVRVERHLRGTMNSPDVMHRCTEHPDARPRVLDAFFTALDAAAAREGDVVISAEIFGRAIALGDDDLLRRFDDLTGRHAVDITYYVRPQHEALQSGWRHWRSTRERRPSEYLARLGRELHHRSTIGFVEAHAPRVTFTVRPCRSDLLEGASAATDFARAVLRTELVVHDLERWRNQGVPVDVANALSAMPVPPPWPAQDDDRVLELVKDLVPTAAEPSPRTRLAALVLQQACHDRYEPENLALIARLGWNTTEWVPPVEADVGDASFARMDELWQTSASASELALLQAALARCLADQRDLRRLTSRRSVWTALRRGGTRHGDGALSSSG